MIEQQTLELHILAECRKKYGLEDLPCSETGKPCIEGNYKIQEITENINRYKRTDNSAGEFFKSGDLNALALIERINHFLIRKYILEYDNAVFRNSLAVLNDQYGSENIDAIFSSFNSYFTMSPQSSLETNIESVPAREKLLEEIILLKICNSNRAAAPFKELFDDAALRNNTPYTPVFYSMIDLFDKAPSFGSQDGNLIKILLEPALKHPDSLQDQIEFMKDRWTFLTDDFLLLLMRGLDLIKEENKIFFAGPGPSFPISYDMFNPDAEDNPNYSPDSNWMPGVILLAKNALVWLDQLSRDYGREIRTLDTIPDEELDLIASRGINCLWLIGIWNRSNASKEIKKRCGNPDAVSSAYSLFSYDISWEIGGWDGLINLRRRCGERGIRLASDMVPNHTGIDSEWTRSRPDWFIQTDRPPFPSYSYHSENLSEDPGIGIYLEDHYYDKSDAAVTFKWVNFQNGETRYIYHGNDGTSMPWNDTAQLDFLKNEVREAVIDQILHVARNFPVIRFDAAMTLAKKHIRRLWYPKPGQGGDIASRANFSMSDDDFNRAVGGEFWKEVVNRVASEAPDTLLLAEAFWMMEGYFVRNLGMHRVYNSAFMNMLKNEENEKYRETIKNTLNYDRKILKRFVNFMNNPDEETAAVQFGTGDKYFGVMTMMLTMPGLPMIGHGQVEGYREKYGMEFQKPLWDEHPDDELVSRHEREIFPIMKKRHLFVSANRFRLYDLRNEYGDVNENVFAYSNRHGSENVLVLYNNSFERTSGIINESVPYIEADKGESRFESNPLAESLGLTCDEKCYCLFKEIKSGDWYIRNSREIFEKGLFVQLNGYESQVFTDIHEVRDSSANRIADIAKKLKGAGTRDLDREYRELVFRPVYEALDLIISRETIDLLTADRRGFVELASKIEKPLEKSLSAIKEFSGGTGDIQTISGYIRKALIHAGEVENLNLSSRDVESFFLSGYADHNKIILYLYSIFNSFGYIISMNEGNRLKRELLDTWMISRYLEDKFRDLGMDRQESLYTISLLKFFYERDNDIKKIPFQPLSGDFLDSMFDMSGFRPLMGINSYEETLWFSKEKFEQYLWWILYIEMYSDGEENLSSLYSDILKWIETSEKSKYDYEVFRKLIEVTSL